MPAMYACTAWETRNIWCFECSALNGIRLRCPHLITGFSTMSSFMNQAAQRDVVHFIADCLQTHTAMTNLELVEVLAHILILR